MSGLNKKNFIPRNALIERTALALAATWYEIGRAQGLTSKYTTPEAYARVHMEKFIPKAIEHLIELMGPESRLPIEAKNEIYDALQDRINDDGNKLLEEEILPKNVDPKILADMTRTVDDNIKQWMDPATQAEQNKPIEIALRELSKSDTAIVNPFMPSKH